MIHRILLIIALTILLTHASHAQTKERITYDDNGRISKVVFTQASQMLTINYEYDKRGNIISTTNELVTDVSDEKKASITITVKPNPSSQEITVESPASDGEMVSYLIIATDGKEVYRKDVRADASGLSRLVVDAAASGLASGSYQVSATTKAGVTTAGFVISK